MAEIPPDIPSSAAQAGFQAREAAKERDARRVGQAEAAKRQVRTVDETGETVDTADADVAVFTDTEGMGSQGRAFQEEEEQAKDETDPDGGLSEGEDGQMHLDLEA
jgi:hypothetical protein